MIETTFTFVKPYHVPVAYQILAELDQHGARLATATVPSVPLEVVELHYSCHYGKPFFRRITTDLAGQTLVLAVYEGDNIIGRFVEIIGPTDPSKAPKHTIRGRYSTDSMAQAEIDGRTVRNVIHRSDSQSEADREISLWLQYLPPNFQAAFRR